MNTVQQRLIQFVTKLPSEEIELHGLAETGIPDLFTAMGLGWCRRLNGTVSNLETKIKNLKRKHFYRKVDLSIGGLVGGSIGLGVWLGAGVVTASALFALDALGAASLWRLFSRTWTHYSESKLLVETANERESLIVNLLRALELAPAAVTPFVLSLASQYQAGSAMVRMAALEALERAQLPETAEALNRAAAVALRNAALEEAHRLFNKGHEQNRRYRRANCAPAIFSQWEGEGGI